MKQVICYFLGTYEDWGGASRSLLNIVKKIDKKRFKPIVALTKEGLLSKKLSNINIEYRIWKRHDRSPNVIKYIWAILKCMQFFKKNKIDLIHINYGCIGWKPAEIIAAWILRIPMVNHYHGINTQPSSYLKYSKMVIAVSKFIAESSESLSVPKRVIYNTADLERFSAGKDIRKDLGLENDNIIISFLGQIKRIKGIEAFVELADRIRNENVRFLIAGEVRQGKDAFSAQEFETLISRNSNTKYLGYRPDVENIYATSDIVVMPSQWDEPCAMVLFEAGAARKPIVCTSTGGTPEIIKHGDNGYLIEKNDIEALIKYTTKLIDDAELRRRIGERNREVMEEKFRDRPIRELEAIYVGLITGSTLD